MKRSDIINIIYNNLTVMRKLDEVAINILDDIEEAGMLPPPTDIEYGITRTLCYVKYSYLEMEVDEEQSLWEPENE